MGRSEVSSGQGRIGSSSPQSERTLVLPAGFYKTKLIWRSPSDFESQAVKQVADSQTLQDGSLRAHFERFRARVMGSVARPDRCIPTYPAPPSAQKVHALGGGGSPFPVRQHVLWLGPGTPSVHQSDGGDRV